MPRRWQLEMEQEENEAAGEFDLLIQEELDNEECDEQADFDFATELLLTELPYEAVEADTAKITNSALSPVPPSITAELQEYESFRQSPFNRHREGGAVVSTTTESDKANTLRFLGFLKSHCEQATPSVKLMASPHVGEWCQRWLEWLKNDHQLKASTLAVYTNGLIAMSSFACTLVEDPAACPTQELLNLRRQAESIAKQERLFQAKSANWLSWEAAQEARVACIDKWRKAKGAEKQALLRDCLIMAFHTLQPVTLCRTLPTPTHDLTTFLSRALSRIGSESCAG